MAGLGGGLILVSALFSFISIPLILAAENEEGSFDGVGSVFEAIYGILPGLTDYIVVGLGIMAAISVVGGVSAIMGGSYRTALAGGVASVFGVAGPLGLAGLFLVATSKDEFRISQSDWTRGRGSQGSSGHDLDRSDRSSADAVRDSMLIRR